jgi:hypothetical protein
MMSVSPRKSSSLLLLLTKQCTLLIRAEWKISDTNRRH